MTRRALTLLLVLAVLTLWTSSETEAGIYYRGWGPRVGLSLNPDQVVAGVHIDLAEIVSNLRFQPNFLLGVGDNTFLASANLAVSWYFPVDGSWTPYAGGALGFSFQSRDEPGDRNINDVDVVLSAVGGAEKRLRSNRRFLVELSLGLVQEPDATVMAGWTF